MIHGAPKKRFANDAGQSAPSDKMSAPDTLKSVQKIRGFVFSAYMLVREGEKKI